MKQPVVWVGSSHKDLTAFPDDARGDAGHELHQVQQAVYVLHAFQKTTRKTRRQDIETARRRYRDVLKLRGDR